MRVGGALPFSENFWVRTRVIRKLRFRTEKLPKAISTKLRQLDKKLAGGSFWDRFCRYVLNTTWEEDHRVNGDDIEESCLPSQRVQKLAAEVAKKTSVFTEHLPKFVTADGRRLYEFSSKLAELRHSPGTVETVIAAQLSALPITKTQFVGGYFSGLKGYAPKFWESAVFRLLEDGPSRKIGVEIVLRSGMSQNILRKLIELYRQGHIQAMAFSHLASWQAERDGIPQALIEEVIAALMNSPNNDALKVAIELTNYYFFDNSSLDYLGTCRT